jgi:hypothetical protein
MPYVIATSPECLFAPGNTLLMHCFQQETYKKGEALHCPSSLPETRAMIWTLEHALLANNASVFSELLLKLCHQN